MSDPESDIEQVRDTSEVIEEWAEDANSDRERRHLESLAFDLLLEANTQEALREEGFKGGEHAEC